MNVMKTFSDWLDYYTEYDVTELYVFIKNDIYNSQLVFGVMWDLTTRKGRFLAILTSFIAYGNTVVHSVFYIITVVKMAKYDIGTSLHSLSIFLSCFMCLLFMSSWHVYRREISKAQLDINIYPYRYEGETTDNENKTFKKYTGVIKRVIYLYAFGTAAIVTLSWYFRETNELVQINGVHLNLPLPLYYPIEINTWTSYVTVVCFQYLYALQLILIMSVTTYTFFGGALNFYEQMNRLISGVERMEERAERLYANILENDRKNQRKRNQTRNQEELVNCYIYCIKETINHHRIIRRSWLAIEKVNSLATLYVFSVISILLAICTHTILGDTFFEQKLAAMYILANSCLGVILICMTGQMYYDKEEDFQFAVYSLPWYNYNKRIVVILNFLLLTVQKPLTMKAMSIVPCHHHTLSVMLKNAYAYHNALRLLH